MNGSTSHAFTVKCPSPVRHSFTIQQLIITGTVITMHWYAPNFALLFLAASAAAPIGPVQVLAESLPSSPPPPATLYVFVILAVVTPSTCLFSTVTPTHRYTRSADVVVSLNSRDCSLCSEGPQPLVLLSGLPASSWGMSSAAVSSQTALSMFF